MKLDDWILVGLITCCWILFEILYRVLLFDYFKHTDQIKKNVIKISTTIPNFFRLLTICSLLFVVFKINIGFLFYGFIMVKLFILLTNYIFQQREQTSKLSVIISSRNDLITEQKIKQAEEKTNALLSSTNQSISSNSSTTLVNPTKSTVLMKKTHPVKKKKMKEVNK